MGDRLLRAERRLRNAVKLVLGPEAGTKIDSNIPELTVIIPQRKIDKVKRIVAEALEKKFLARSTLNSLVGVLRHVVTFIPIAKPFIQRLISTQHPVEQPGSPGTPMTDKLRLDLK
ncbi:hypothetical protein PHMEG_00010395 [Phytophthora megakarya]|uniref:Uncharacterized protein n=1 Tax=Phytophthora megakarya TaxID=4795 RepID=A0A225WFJ5_9STRA|nr:hypothetical protein PHMEG_00010395 [Phytophthora megakarya]